MLWADGFFVKLLGSVCVCLCVNMCSYVCRNALFPFYCTLAEHIHLHAWFRAWLSINLSLPLTAWHEDALMHFIHLYTQDTQIICLNVFKWVLVVRPIRNHRASAVCIDTAGWSWVSETRGASCCGAQGKKKQVSYRWWKQFRRWFLIPLLTQSECSLSLCPRCPVKCVLWPQQVVAHQTVTACCPVGSGVLV